jgi:hypothetical protein
MKKCPYCGAEYPDDAIVCTIDQTPFEEEAPRASENFRKFLQSSVGLAITTGLAIFLINTGVYCAVGRAYLKIYEIFHPNDIAPPPVREIITTSTLIRWILIIGFAFFTVNVCRTYCGKQWQGIFVAIITFGITALLLLLPGIALIILVPAFFIGLTTDSSAGYYIGSAFQIFFGAWLLGWLGRRKASATIKP